MCQEHNRKLADNSLDSVLVIIPVRNEEATIARVIRDLQAHSLSKIRVVDNGSTDRSAIQAQQAGAEVLFEPVAGYGRACWRGLQDLPPEIDWVLFCDGDGSDDLDCLPQFLARRDRYDLILGDRRATVVGQAVMTPVQIFGNALAGFLINLGWGYRYRDLGPLRLIRRSALTKLEMQDRGMGWTVEMQVKAVEAKLRICELPVGYRPRQGGKSKISGTVSGSIKAGTVILTTLGKLYLRRLPNRVSQNQLGLWLSTILLLSGSIAIANLGDFNQTATVPRFWLGVAIMGLGFMVSWSLNYVPARWFWLVAIATRLFLLFMYPGDDIWRYVWEGYIQNQGFSPYNFAPNAPELIPYRTEWWSLINHRDVSAIYPPITQLGFRGLAAIAPHFLLFKISFALADLAICWLLTCQFSYRQTTLYAWNPLVLYSFAGGGHYDSWFILPLVAAWLCLNLESDKSAPPVLWLVSAFFVGISIAVKWISLPILSFITWQAWRKTSFKTAIIVLIVGIIPMLLSSLAFCRPDACYLIPTSSTFVNNGRSAELLPYLLGQIWRASRDNNSIFALPLGLVTIWLILRSHNLQQFATGYFFSLLTISPIVHGWYFTWIVPFAVPTQNWGVRLVSISAFIYFVLPYRQGLGYGNWRLTPTETWLLWLPFILGYFWTLRQRSAIAHID